MITLEQKKLNLTSAADAIIDEIADLESELMTEAGLNPDTPPDAQSEPRRTLLRLAVAETLLRLSSVPGRAIRLVKKAEMSEGFRLRLREAERKIAKAGLNERYQSLLSLMLG